MAQMPADAPRSEDGQWWWDGSAWQPVASGQAAAGSAQYLATGEIAAGTDVGLPDIEMGVSHIAEVLLAAGIDIGEGSRSGDPAAQDSREEYA